MKNLHEQEKILFEDAISIIEETLTARVYEDKRVKDKVRREIALKEIDVVINSILYPMTLQTGNQ